MCAGDARDFHKRIERTAVDVPGLRDDDHRALRLLHRLRKRGRLHRSVTVDGNLHEIALAEAEILQPDEDGGVRLLAEHDGDRRRASHTVRLKIVASAAQHRAACRREAGEARHGGARDEADRRLERKVEKVEQGCR